MLLVEPAFLPLQPLSAPVCPASPIVHSTLPSSCSINSLRRSFTPFPLRPATSRIPRERSRDETREWEVRPASTRVEMTVRAMKSSDVEFVKRLQTSCLPLAYPSTFYTLLLTNPSSLCLLAFSPRCPSILLGCISGHLLSYTQCSLSDDDSEGDGQELPIVYLTSLAVDRLARNQGVGFQLVQDLVSRLLESSSQTPTTVSGKAAVLQLHVEAKNENAIKLYRKLGLSETRRIRGHYRGISGGGDAIEMRGVVKVQE
ncbi:hypothetical protein JCM5350_003825 [Sporobolomyces pararoseus]